MKNILRIMVIIVLMVLLNGCQSPQKEATITQSDLNNIIHKRDLNGMCAEISGKLENAIIHLQYDGSEKSIRAKGEMCYNTYVNITEDTVEYLIKGRVIRTQTKEDLWKRLSGMNWKYDDLIRFESDRIFESLGGVVY